MDVPPVIEPDLVIEEFKKDIDRTLLRENLKRTVEYLPEMSLSPCLPIEFPTRKDIIRPPIPAGHCAHP